MVTLILIHMISLTPSLLVIWAALFFNFLCFDSPRSIGDFFTWGPVVTDNAYYREVRLRPGPLANVTVRQPIEALNEMQRMNIPVIMGTSWPVYIFYACAASGSFLSCIREFLICTCIPVPTVMFYIHCFTRNQLSRGHRVCVHCIPNSHGEVYLPGPGVLVLSFFCAEHTKNVCAADQDAVSFPLSWLPVSIVLFLIFAVSIRAHQAITVQLCCFCGIIY